MNNTRLIVKLFIAIAAVVGLCIFGEIFIRIIKPKETFILRLPAIFMKEDYGPVYKPNSIVEHSKKPDFQVTYKTNSKGLRDIEHPYNKPEGEYRICVLGDSFAAGYGVKSESTFPSLMKKYLQTQVSEDINVINAAVSSTGTYTQLKYLENEIIQYKPDLVILSFFGVNDIEEVGRTCPTLTAGKESYYREYVNTKTVSKYKILKSIKEWMFKHSHLYVFLEERWDVLLQRLYMRPKKFRSVPIILTNYNEEFQKYINKTKEIILEMQNFCEKENADFLVVMIPSAIAVEKGRWARRMYGPQEVKYSDKFYDQTLMKVTRIFEPFLNENKINYINLIYDFRKHSGEGLYFLEDGHWNDNGHKLAADLLSKYLMSEGLLLCEQSLKTSH